MKLFPKLKSESIFFGVIFVGFLGTLLIIGLKIAVGSSWVLANVGFTLGQLFIVFSSVLIAGAVLSNKTRPFIYRSVLSFSDDAAADLFLPETKQPWVPVFFQFFLFVLVSFLYFYNLQDTRLFLSVDGDHQLSVNEQNKVWSSEWYYFGGNFLQGLGGNVGYPLGTNVDPGFFLGNLFEKFSTVIAHVGWACLLFFSGFLYASLFKLNRLSSLFCAWVTPILILFPGPWSLAPVPLLIPWIATTLFIFVCIQFVLLNDFRGRLTTAFLRAIVLTVLCLWLLLHYPLYLILVAPPCVIAALVKIYFIKGGNEKFKEIAVYFTAATIVALLGAAFFLGLVSYTSVAIFGDELVKRQFTKSSLTILLNKNSVLITFIVGVSLLTMAIGVVNYRKMPSAFIVGSSAMLIFFTLIIGIGVFFIVDPKIWDGPAPNYFEFMLWPFYCLGFSLLILKGVNEALRLLSQDKSNPALNALFSGYLVPSLIAVGLTLYSQDRLNNRSWEFPPVKDPIMEVLQNAAYAPYDDFKGRVSTFTGRELRGNLQWADLQHFDYLLLAETGNDYRKAGLWYNHIPTLTEYASTITPRSFFYIKSFLSLKGDRQERGMMTMRSPATRFLRPIGVRWLITDKREPGLKLLASVTSKMGTIHLQEIQNVNMGNWSPTEYIVSKNLNSIKRLLSEDSFDFEKKVVLEQEIFHRNATKAINANMKVVQNGYQVKASSKGFSFLLLPVEFSNCFTLSVQSGDLNAELLAANIFQSVLVFENEIDVLIEYRNGPLTNSDCRLKDQQQFAKLID